MSVESMRRGLHARHVLFLDLIVVSREVHLLKCSFFFFRPTIEEITLLVSSTRDSNINFFKTEILGNLRGQTDPKKKDDKQLN